MSGPAGQRLAAALARVRERYRESIAGDFPRTSRCTSGYNLRELLAPEPNLGRLLAGSEGTLALFTELEVQLDRRPARRVGAAFTFATLRAALEANVAILDTGPSAVEFLDLAPLRLAPNLARYRHMAPLLDGDEAALLTVEYQGSDEEARAGLEQLRSIAGSLGAIQTVWLEEADTLAEAAALRRAVLPLLMGAPGAERPAAFVEDTAVAPERLADFVADLQRLVAAHGTRASFTGHASAGCLHLRPMLDLKTATGVARMDALAQGVARLVADYHGAVSGEHGCGRSRSWFLPQLLGPELYEAMTALKDAFDPGRLLNPGVVVDGPPVTESLRFGADYRGDRAWTPRLSYVGGGRVRARRGEVLRRRAVQEAHRHDVPARHGHARRGTLHAGARQRSAGRPLRRRAAGRSRRGGVPGGARHVRGLQGLQDGVPCRRGHGGAQGGVAGGGQGARGRATAGARRRGLPTAGGARRPGRSRS